MAKTAGLNPPVRKWNPRERAILQDELDAAYFLLYGIERDDMEYILSTFTIRDATEPELFPSGNLILEAYNHLATRSAKR